MASVYDALPMFGVAPHTPGKQALAERQTRRRFSCPTCGAGPRYGSVFICMDCHRAAPAMERAAARHCLPECDHNRMKAQPKAKAKARPKGKVKRKPVPKSLPLVESYLAALAQAEARPA